MRPEYRAGDLWNKHVVGCDGCAYGSVQAIGTGRNHMVTRIAVRAEHLHPRLRFVSVSEIVVEDDRIVLAASGQAEAALAEGTDFAGER